MPDLTAEQRLHYARELHSNPLLKDFLADMKEEAVAAWDGTTEGQNEERERAWRMRQAANDFERRIIELILKETKT